MKKTIRRYFWLILCGVLLAACTAVLMVMHGDPNEGRLPRQLDTEFARGSGIVLDDATALQKESLYKLAKVWGYVKYRHPSIIAGQINWDAELFRVMPQVLQAADEKAVNTVLLDWLNRFPFEQATAEAAQSELEMLAGAPGTRNDSSWISDRAFLGEGLCAYLEPLSHTHAGDWTYAYTAREDGRVDFPTRIPGRTLTAPTTACGCWGPSGSGTPSNISRPTWISPASTGTRPCATPSTTCWRPGTGPGTSGPWAV